MKCYLIRHGITEGNQKLSFNGCRIDEPLTQEGRNALKEVFDEPFGFMLFTSPMKRAVETASIMFPGKIPTVIDELKEMDFGVFEGKNHKMLDGDPEYQAWLDSGGTAKIPGGESIAIFGERVREGFKRVLALAAKNDADTICIVAHGGTIMALMSLLTGEDYFSFNPPNGAGYMLELETDDAGNVTAATTYDRFCGGLRAGSDGWRPPRYTPSDSVDRQAYSQAR